MLIRRGMADHAQLFIQLLGRIGILDDVGSGLGRLRVSTGAVACPCASWAQGSLPAARKIARKRSKLASHGNAIEQAPNSAARRNPS